MPKRQDDRARGNSRGEAKGRRGPLPPGRFTLAAQAGGPKPQRLVLANRLQRHVVEVAKRVPCPDPTQDLCAFWVEQVFWQAGVGCFWGDACDLYNWWCPTGDLAQLKVGMIVAVPSHPHGMAGRTLGHVGIYVGDGHLRDCVGATVRTTYLLPWLDWYGASSEPRWGWIGGVDLT